MKALSLGSWISLRRPVRLLLLSLQALVAIPGSGTAQNFTAAGDFSAVLATVKRRVIRQSVPVETVRLSTAADGALRYLGAPPDHHFLPDGAKFVSPDDAATGFVLQNGRLLGVKSDRVALRVVRSRVRRNRSIVTLGQSYAGVPVFGAEIKAQVNADEGVEALLSHLATDLGPLESGDLKVQPTLAAERAATMVPALLAPETRGLGLDVGRPRLVLFDPTLLGETGPIRLAWQINAATRDGVTLDQEVFLDAHTGELIERISNLYDALDREIYDAANSNSDPGTLLRSEGGPASTVKDVNGAYTAYGEVYTFYQTYHGRDSYDDEGSTLSATVRFCDSTILGPGCSFSKSGQWNASRKRMYFGPGMTVDDITGHEVTHGVTRDESGLIYKNESGAINESFSDLWGEFIDLTDGTGNDSSSVRWLVGEDAPKWLGKGLRDMMAPTNFMDADRLNSPLYQPPSDTSDNGGVHHNSGVNNKLCFLLTDGQTFNGQTVQGMGIQRIADLYYEAQTGILTSTSGWTDLFHALQQAAINLDWTVAERNNLFRACLAVEIADPQGLWVNGHDLCPFPNGAQTCTFPIPFWQPSGGGPYWNINQANAGANPGDVLHIVTGHYNESVLVNKRLRLVPEGGPLLIGQP